MPRAFADTEIRRAEGDDAGAGQVHLQYGRPAESQAATIANHQRVKSRIAGLGRGQGERSIGRARQVHAVSAPLELERRCAGGDRGEGHTLARIDRAGLGLLAEARHNGGAHRHEKRIVPSELGEIRGAEIDGVNKTACQDHVAKAVARKRVDRGNAQSVDLFGPDAPPFSIVFEQHVEEIAAAAERRLSYRQTTEARGREVNTAGSVHDEARVCGVISIRQLPAPDGAAVGPQPRQVPIRRPTVVRAGENGAAKIKHAVEITEHVKAAVVSDAHLYTAHEALRPHPVPIAIEPGQKRLIVIGSNRELQAAQRQAIGEKAAQIEPARAVGLHVINAHGHVITRHGGFSGPHHVAVSVELDQEEGGLAVEVDEFVRSELGVAEKDSRN